MQVSLQLSHVTRVLFFWVLTIIPPSTLWEKFQISKISIQVEAADLQKLQKQRWVLTLRKDRQTQRLYSESIEGRDGLLFL